MKDFKVMVEVFGHVDKQHDSLKGCANGQVKLSEDPDMIISRGEDSEAWR